MAEKESHYERIDYRNPAENKEIGDDPIHTIDLIIDGKVAGRAEITYYSRPFPLYQVSELYVEPEYQRQGNAGKIMEYIENMLVEKRKAGVLVDAINIDNPASGMYERRGWLACPPKGLGRYAFNLPDGADVQDLIGYESRYTDVRDRESWQGKFME